MHAGQPDLAPKGFGDGLRDDQLRRMHGSLNHPEATPVPVGGSSEPKPSSRASGLGALVHAGLFEPLHVLPLPHRIRTGTRRTDPDLSSSLRATRFAMELGESTARHPEPQPSCARFDRTMRTVESRSAAGTSQSAPSSRCFARNGSPQPSHFRVGLVHAPIISMGKVSRYSHFATFPPALVEPRIRAGIIRARRLREVAGHRGGAWRETSYGKSTDVHGEGSITGRRDGGDAGTHY